MLAQVSYYASLCLYAFSTYYAQNYASIIRKTLIVGKWSKLFQHFFLTVGTCTMYHKGFGHVLQYELNVPAIGSYDSLHKPKPSN